MPVAEGSSSQIGRGPTDITKELEEEEQIQQSTSSFAERPFLQDWYDFKDRLEREHHFQFGIAYSALYQRASDTFLGKRGEQELLQIYDALELSPPPLFPVKDAAGGIVELQGTWTVIRPNTPNKGFIAFSLENRHKLGTEIPPQNLFLDDGSYWPSGMAFGEFKSSLIGFYYEQYMFDGRFGVRVGKTIPFGIYDYFSLKNPKTSFSDANLTLNTAIAQPTFGFGVAAVYRPVEQLYILGGVHDLNGGPHRGIETFFTENEYYKAIEVGWDSKFEHGDGNIHVLYWHSGMRQSTGSPETWGITVGGEQAFGRFLPFFRYGYSDGGAAALQHMIVGGLGITEMFGRQNDVLGIGASWGRPFFSDIFIDQSSVEVFYRAQLTKEFQLTASVNYIIDPAVNLDADEITVIGIRGRAAF